MSEYQQFLSNNFNLNEISFQLFKSPDDDYMDEPEDEDEEEKGPALEIYGTDLTLLARQGQLEECFGREKELLELMEILVRRQKNNPVLVGDAGVGKTAIIELFANKIVNNLVPFVLEGRSLISLDLARIVAGSRYRGEFELRFQRVLDEVLSQPNIIIFIDEIHNIGGTGSAEGSLDAANILKPVLSRSGFQCIGATTTKEYQRIEKDPALNRRFQPIKVKEPSVDDTVRILYGLRSSLEGFHNVEILPGALRLSAELADRYIYDRFLPDKAIDLIDRAAAKEVIRLTNVTEGSVISAIVNAGLNNIGTLRVEAFRRGDIPTEFVFQEIENAYRNFLLRWVETPLSIPEEPIPLLSPISQALFDTMRMAVLTRVDDLLFSSNKPRSIKKTITNHSDLSTEQNQQVYRKVISKIGKKHYLTSRRVQFQITNADYSTYRFSLYTFAQWTKANQERRLKSYIRINNSLLNKYYYDTCIGKKFSLLSKYVAQVKFASDPRPEIYNQCVFLFDHNINKNKLESTNEENPYVFSSPKDVTSKIGFPLQNGTFMIRKLKIWETSKITGLSLSDVPYDQNLQHRAYTILLRNYIRGKRFQVIFKKVLDMNYSMFGQLSCMRLYKKRDPINFTCFKDFLAEDVYEYEETFEILSELEQKRIEVVQDFLFDLKPVLRRGVIESLRSSSDLKLSNEELTTIHALLGYFSTSTGRSFLANLDDPELIRKARQLGDFTGLKKRITQKEIRELLADMTGIPIQSLSNEESQKLVNLESTLHKRVIGQEEAVSAIAKAIRRSRLGIQNPNRPIASFLFCGPTGVGKTEVTKALAVSMFGAESDMIRFDMSEFMEKFTVSRMIGSPPGYVGYDDGGQLTDAVRRKPYSVVLFDEVEKAHPDILNVLLQILEDGRLTDSQKRLIPFENTVIIMTSNAAADEIQQILKSETSSRVIEEVQKIEDSVTSSDDIYEDGYAGAIKFLKSPINENFLVDLKKELSIEFQKSFRNAKTYDVLEKEIKQAGGSEKAKKDAEQKTMSTLKNAVLERLSTMFLPEFLNRLDDIIIFQPLKPEELRKICDIMVNDVAKRIQTKNIILTVDDKVKLKLTREGYNPAFGARPLRRLVTKYIEDLISENLLKTPLTGKKVRTIKIILNEDDQIIVKQDNSIIAPFY